MWNWPSWRLLQLTVLRIITRAHFWEFQNSRVQFSISNPQRNELRPSSQLKGFPSLGRLSRRTMKLTGTGQHRPPYKLFLLLRFGAKKIINNPSRPINSLIMMLINTGGDVLLFGAGKQCDPSLSIMHSTIVKDGSFREGNRARITARSNGCLWK